MIRVEGIALHAIAPFMQLYRMNGAIGLMEEKGESRSLRFAAG